MKILFVHSLSAFASQGGAEVSLRCLTQALTAAGHECVMLVTGGRLGIRRREFQGVRVIEAGLWNLYPMFDGKTRPAVVRLAWHGIDRFNHLMQRIVSRIAAEERPDVASVHNLAGWSVSAWAALVNSGVPIVQVLHDQYALCASSMMFRGGHNCRQQCLSCRALRSAHPRRSNQVTAVVGVSRFILDRHRAFGCFRDVSVQRVIHNARWRDDFQPLISETKPSPDQTMRFGFIGSINPSKGVEYLIEAFGDAALESAELWIAGDLKTDYARALADRTTDARVRFLGRMNPAEFFAEIDALVLPSLWRDTFPGVAFESLIFGRPVIAVNHGGAPEIVRDGHNGLIFDPQEPGALGRCLERLAAAPALLRELSAHALADSAYYLDTDRWINQYLAVYRDAISVAATTSSTAGASR